jgi:3-oxoacyl-[acyl-carrier protein] reductase
MSERKNRPVLVTGASKGIGKAIATRLGAAGYPITVHYGHDVAGAEAVAAEIIGMGGTATVVGFDTADREACRAALERLCETQGAFWGIVQNAGIAKDNAFPALTGEDWDSVIHTNVDGFYNVVHPLVMPMIRRRDGGRIVALSSVSGIMGNRGQVNYSASKAAIIGACKALSVELAKRDITVNCIAPGVIETAMTGDLPEDQVCAVIPMRRVGKPHEVAALAEFLFTDEASYITRQVISVNGGLC